jgi:hypothetical protein
MRVNLRRFEFSGQWLLRFSCEDTIFKSFAFLIHSEEKIDIIEKNGSEQNAICGLLIDEAFLKFMQICAHKFANSGEMPRKAEPLIVLFGRIRFFRR